MFSKNFQFSSRYFIITILIFIIEVLIAKYASGWIRNYLGDMLVVILVYTSVRSFIKVNRNFAIIATFIFACSVEISQYFKLAEILGFTKGSIAYIILGNTFSVEDLLCYALGCLLIFACHYLNDNNKAFPYLQ